MDRLGVCSRMANAVILDRVLLVLLAIIFFVCEEVLFSAAAALSAGEVKTLAGSGAADYEDGFGTSASFQRAFGAELSQDGTILYVADAHNHRLRVIDIATSMVTTLAGSGTGTHQDGTGTAASFDNPSCIQLSSDGSRLFVW